MIFKELSQRYASNTLVLRAITPENPIHEKSRIFEAISKYLSNTVISYPSVFYKKTVTPSINYLYNKTISLKDHTYGKLKDYTYGKGISFIQYLLSQQLIVSLPTFYIVTLSHKAFELFKSSVSSLPSYSWEIISEITSFSIKELTNLNSDAQNRVEEISEETQQEFDKLTEKLDELSSEMVKDRDVLTGYILNHYEMFSRNSDIYINAKYLSRIHDLELVLQKYKKDPNLDVETLEVSNFVKSLYLASNNIRNNVEQEFNYQLEKTNKLLKEKKIDDIPTYLITNKLFFFNHLSNAVKSFNDRKTKTSDIETLLKRHEVAVSQHKNPDLRRLPQALITLYNNHGIDAVEELYTYRTLQKLEQNLEKFNKIYKRRHSIIEQYPDKIKGLRYQCVRDEMAGRIAAFFVCSAIPVLGPIIMVQSASEILISSIQEPYLLVDIAFAATTGTYLITDTTRNLVNSTYYNKSLENDIKESVKQMEQEDTQLIVESMVQTR